MDSTSEVESISMLPERSRMFLLLPGPRHKCRGYCERKKPLRGFPRQGISAPIQDIHSFIIYYLSFIIYNSSFRIGSAGLAALGSAFRIGYAGLATLGSEFRIQNS